MDIISDCSKVTYLMFQQDRLASLTLFIKMCPEVYVADNSNMSQDPAF